MDIGHIVLRPDKRVSRVAFEALDRDRCRVFRKRLVVEGQIAIVDAADVVVPRIEVAVPRQERAHASCLGPPVGEHDEGVLHALLVSRDEIDRMACSCAHAADEIERYAALQKNIGKACGITGSVASSFEEEGAIARVALMCSCLHDCDLSGTALMSTVACEKG